MDRRTALKLLGIGALGTSVGTCFAALGSSAETGKTVQWGYIGENGPDHWGDLSSEFQLCKVGNEQSPIDLKEAITAKLDEIEINYKESPLHIINNGHSIQVNYEPGSSITLNDQTFNLIQFHFHNPSEHSIEGTSFAMELHLVHRSEAGALAVIGVLLKEGELNTALQPIWQVFPTEKGPEQTKKDIIVNAAQFLPEDRKVYRYFGSLTTPPCSQGVNWIVMQQPVEISIRQIQQFNKLMSKDARPIQPINNRFLLRSF